MGGTKIIVLQLKELIKTGIFAVIGLIFIIMLIYFFIPKDKSSSSSNTSEPSSLYNAGTYSSEILLHNAPLNLEVTVTENEIISVEFMNLTDAHTAFYPLLEATMNELSSEVISKQTTNLETSIDSEVTSKLLLSAIDTAIAQAKVEEN